jgi:hypothetical protein
MPSVTVTVPPYPFDGVVGFQVEEQTMFGAVDVLDTSSVGTFPNYTTDYAVTVTDVNNPLRVRWETATDQYSEYFGPSSVSVTPTTETEERLAQALIQKATRILMLSKAPLGSWGELNEFGVATVRSDHEIQELLYGLRFVNWNVDLPTLVDTDTVIRVGMQADPSTFPTDRIPDVQRAIDAAASWLAAYVLYGTNVA